MNDLILKNWSNLDHFFEDTLNEVFSSRNGNNLTDRFKKSSYPKLDIYDSGNSTIIQAALPGLTKQDVDVSWKNNVLTIKGNSRKEKQENFDQYYLKELHKSSFAKSLTVDSSVYNINNIKAETKDGLLTIKLERKEQLETNDKVKKIEVK